MAKAIEILTFIKVDEKPTFTATGTCDDAPFAARTILWGPKDNKEPIFKVVEDGKSAVALDTSSFTRGERIAIARALKNHRLKLDEPTASKVVAGLDDDARAKLKASLAELALDEEEASDLPGDEVPVVERTVTGADGKQHAESCSISALK
jgi:hypothetical protein